MPSVISETPHISRQSYSHMQLQSYLKHGNLSSPSTDDLLAAARGRTGPERDCTFQLVTQQTSSPKDNNVKVLSKVKFSEVRTLLFKINICTLIHI